MKRITGTAVVFATIAAVSCGDGRFMRVGLQPYSGSGIPAFQQANDSVRLYATEWRHGLSSEEPSVPTSSESPESYTWSSNNPAVAEMRPSGWMITHAVGQVTITVQGPRSTLSQVVSVCSRDTELRIDPRDPVIRLHDTITVGVAFVQPGGAPCGEIDFGPFMPQQGSGTAGLEPIFSQPNRWRAIRPGTFWYTSALQFAQRTLRDSILVTVR